MNGVHSTQRDEIEMKSLNHRWLSVYIVAYLFSILLLLTLLRYAAGSAAMDRYIFSIAQETQWVMQLLGEPAQLENPDQFKGREIAVRTRLAVANDPAETYESTQQPEPSLSPWECWRYRRLELQRSIHDESMKSTPDAQRLAQLHHILKSTGPVVFCGTDRSPENFQFQVVPDCSGLSAMAIFAVAVMIFPAPWRKRVLGLILGLLLLHGINVCRLAFLALLGSYTQGGAWFHFAHNYAWEVINIFIIIFLWMAWIALFLRPKSQQGREES